MQIYTFSTEEEGSKIWLLTMEEFIKLDLALPHKKSFLQGMRQIQYCKLETYRECILGTMCVPTPENDQIIKHRFGFYQLGYCLFGIGEEAYLKEYIEKMDKKSYQEYNARLLLLLLMEKLLEEDVLYLQEQEQHLTELEEKLLVRIPEHFNERIIRYRKRFTIFHAYYEQLMNIGDIMQTTMSLELTAEERAGWQLYANRAERLHDHVELLREYLVQIRELYESLINLQQNKVMSMLTVVTTIFLPLTLIAGWYGMNFKSMPEFGWKYAYPVVIMVSVMIIVLEIVFFKKKKML